MTKKVYDLRRGDVLPNGWTVETWRSAEDRITAIIELHKDGCNTEILKPYYDEIEVR